MVPQPSKPAMALRPPRVAAGATPRAGMRAEARLPALWWLLVMGAPMGSVPSVTRLACNQGRCRRRGYSGRASTRRPAPLRWWGRQSKRNPDPGRCTDRSRPWSTRHRLARCTGRTPQRRSPDRSSDRDRSRDASTRRREPPQWPGTLGPGSRDLGTGTHQWESWSTRHQALPHTPRRSRRRSPDRSSDTDRCRDGSTRHRASPQWPGRRLGRNPDPGRGRGRWLVASTRHRRPERSRHTQLQGRRRQGQPARTKSRTLHR